MTKQGACRECYIAQYMVRHLNQNIDVVLTTDCLLLYKRNHLAHAQSDKLDRSE